MPHLLPAHLLAVLEAKPRHAGLEHLPVPLHFRAGLGELHPAASITSAYATSSMPSSASTLTRSVGSWLRSVPLARQMHSNPLTWSALASEPPPVSDVARGVSAGLERPLGHHDRLGPGPGPVALEHPLHHHVEVALGRVGGVLEMIDHLGRHRLHPRGVKASGLRLDPAPLGHHVGVGPTRDRAHVGRGHRIEPAEAHGRDARRGGGDGAAAVLGPDAGVRGPAVELGRDPVIGRGGEHDLADRGGVVEDIAVPALQAGRVELLGPEQRDLLAHREQQLDPDRRGLGLGQQAAGKLERDRDRGLVVGAQDAVVGVLPSPVDQHGLDRRRGRHRVQMGADEDAALARAGDAGEQVAGVRARALTGVILLRVEPHLLELADDPVGAFALPAGRALDPAQGREGFVQPLAILVGGASHARVALITPSPAR